MKSRLFSSVCFLIPLMYVAMGGMLGFPMPQFLTGTENILVNTLTQLLLTVPVLIINKKFLSDPLIASILNTENNDNDDEGFKEFAVSVLSDIYTNEL